MCIGTDCTTKSAFLLSNEDVIFYCIQNFAWTHYAQFYTRIVMCLFYSNVVIVEEF